LQKIRDFYKSNRRRAAPRVFVASHPRVIPAFIAFTYHHLGGPLRQAALPCFPVISAVAGCDGGVCTASNHQRRNSRHPCPEASSFGRSHPAAPERGAIRMFSLSSLSKTLTEAKNAAPNVDELQAALGTPNVRPRLVAEYGRQERGCSSSRRPASAQPTTRIFLSSKVWEQRKEK